MDSASFFHRISPEEFFHIIAAELNFIYETLFTKLYVAHTKPGYFFRAMSFGATSIALVCFHKFDKHDLDRLDVVITYSLICGAMALDSIALFMLIFSDWTVAFATPKDGLQSKNYWQSCWETIRFKYLDLKKPNLYYSSNTSSFLRWSRQILFGRSSESIYTFNLIDYALQESSPPTSCGIFFLQKIGLFICCLQHFRQRLSSCGSGGPKRGSLFGLKDLLDKIKYGFMLSSTPFSKDLWEFIFIDLREKKTNNRDLWDATGGWILRYGGCPGLLPCVRDRDYEDNIILWHIATTICYYSDKSNAGDGNPPREYSTTLSDYMFYLLLMQPTLMSSVTTIGQEAVLSHTFDAIAKICFRDSEPREVLKREEACKRILGANPSISNNCTINVKPSKPPLLFLARDLAKELIKLEDKKWDVISQVWVYLLSYAATHCRPSSYAQLLSNGGELVAFVWLLMEHLEVRGT